MVLSDHTASLMPLEFAGHTSSRAKSRSYCRAREGGTVTIVWPQANHLAPNVRGFMRFAVWLSVLGAAEVTFVSSRLTGEARSDAQLRAVLSRGGPHCEAET
jgi:hypothetical protein